MPLRIRCRPRVEHLEDRVTPTGNILITTPPFGGTYQVKEYTPDGTLVRTYTPTQTDDTRDVIVAPNGDLELFNGTFSPVLSTYHVATGTWTDRTADNWSTVNNLTFGGVAAFGDYVYVTDMTTAGDSAPSNGIIRFNMLDSSWQRFAAGTDYIEMTLGLDGLIYAMQDWNGLGNPIDVYDPFTMDHLRSVNAPIVDGRGLAVAANGDIYVADWNDHVTRLDAGGNVLGSITLNGGISDINISNDGKLVLGGVESIMNADFTNIHYFDFGTYHVAFADPQYPPPAPQLGSIEPGPLAYTAGQPATDVTGSITLTDAYSATIASATVTITAGFTSGEDQLGFTDQNGITGSYNAATGVLTLTGAASRADYQAALRSVTYANSNFTPSTVTRTVTFTVDDGRPTNHLSNAVSRDVTVTRHVAPTVINTETTLLNYTAGEAGIVITSTLGLTSQSGNLAGATVKISAGFVAGEDTLDFPGASGISGSYDPTTGILTLSGTASVADYQAALRSVTYSDSNLDPTEGVRTLSIQVDDGFPVSHASNTKTRGVAVFKHVAPVLEYIEPDALQYSAGQPPAQLTCYLAVETQNGIPEDITSATVTISGGFVPGEDVLTYIDLGIGISATYDAEHGVLALTGAKAPEDYELAFRLVRYINTNDHPSLDTRTVTFQVDDGFAYNHLSNTSERHIEVSDHVAPQLSGIESTAGSYTAGHSPTAVTSALTVAAPASSTIAGATVSISTGFVIGEDVLAFTDQNGITGSYDATSGVLTLAGAASIADYQTALRSITYADSILNPATTPRTITFQIDDGFSYNNTSNTQSRDITVLPHAAPALAGIEATSLAFTEGNGAKKITSTLTVSGPADATLVGAIVAISGGFAGSQDVLAFSNQNGITGAYDAATGVLTLSGAATAANYQAALRGVTYVNTSQNPSTALRTIAFQVDDGFAFNHLSSPVSRSVVLTAINNAPTLTVPATGPTGSRNFDIAVTGISVADVDGNSGAEKLTLAVGHGAVRFASLAGLAVVAGANGGATVTVQGTLASLNAALAGGNLVYHSTGSFSGAETLSVALDDAGNTGVGGAHGASGSVGITVVNHVVPALGHIETTPLAFTEGQAPKLVTTSLMPTVFGSALAGATVAITGHFAGAEDVLAFAPQLGITGSYDAATGVLTLSGSASWVAYTLALHSVTYVNTSRDPSTATRTISFQIDDGTAFDHASNVVSRNVTIAAVNNAPTLALPLSPSAFANADAVLGAITVGDVDAEGKREKLTLTVAHGILQLADLTNVQVVGGANNSPTITLLGPIDSLNPALGSGNLVYCSAMTFIGTDTLRLTLSDAGNTGAGGVKSATASLPIHVSHVAPVLDGIEAAPASFTEGGAATPLTAALSVADSDSLTINRATVAITGGFARGEDVLAFTKQNNITGSYNAFSGVLTLSGVSSLANYETALRSVTYFDKSQNPSTALRAITFQVGDGAASNAWSNKLSRTIEVVAVNTAPVLTVPTLAPTGKANTDIFLNFIKTADPDANGAVEELTLTVAHGAVRLARLTGITVVGGANGSATVTIQGTIAQLNAALASSNLIYHSDAGFIGADTLDLALDDLGNTGLGGGLVAHKTLAINVK